MRKTTDEFSKCTCNHNSEHIHVCEYKSMAGSDFKNRRCYTISIVILVFVCLVQIVVIVVYVKPGTCNKTTSSSELEEDTTTLQDITEKYTDESSSTILTDKSETSGSTHRYDESGATTLSNNPEAGITAHLYGELQDGTKVTSYKLRNGYMQVQILNFGGIITHIRVPDKHGKTEDIVLGFDNLEEYERRSLAFGAIVGRYANTIANNKFSLDGVTYTLEEEIRASGSGSKGFSKRLWDSRIENDALILTYVSPDGEDGFPGNVNVTVTYELTDRNELIITYRATTDKATVINLTNRSFFNLAGHASGDLNDHTVRIAADYYTPVGDNNIPTGNTESVKGTKYDTTANTRLGSRLTQVPGGRGYDTNFAFGKPDWDKHMASVSHTKSGRTLDIYSTEPGLQFNTGYDLQGIMGKGGVVYNQFGGFSLEAQHYPNSPNEPRFPTTILRPDNTYIQETKYVFGTHA